MAEKTETNPRGAGRPAKVDNQAVILAHKVMDVNKRLDRGLSKIGDNYPDIAQTAIDIALGKGTINVMTANGPRIMERNPDVPMLRHLLSVGIEMIDKTGEGPDSPSQQILKNMQGDGHISHLEVQVPYECMVEGKKICKYIADFRYWCKDQYVVEDTKGIVTQVFRLKKKLVEATHPGVIVHIIKDPREWPPRTVSGPHPSHEHLQT